MTSLVSLERELPSLLNAVFLSSVLLISHYHLISRRRLHLPTEPNLTIDVEQFLYRYATIKLHFCLAYHLPKITKQKLNSNNKLSTSYMV